MANNSFQVVEKMRLEERGYLRSRYATANGHSRHIRMCRRIQDFP